MEYEDFVAAKRRAEVQRLIGALSNTRRWHELTDHDCDKAAAELRRLEAANAELLAALKGTTQELLDVLRDINNDRIPFDGDEFHERLEAGKAAIKRHEGES